MLSKLRPRSVYDVLAAIACFGVLAGGTAYASHELINSSDVVDDSLLSQDIKNQTVGTSDLAIGAVFGTRIRDNAILSSHVVDGTLTAADIGTLPTVSVTQGVTQEGDGQALNFGLEHFDVSQMHAAGGDNTRLVAPRDGIYQVSARVAWEPDGSGGRTLAITKNTFQVAQDTQVPLSEHLTMTAASVPLKLAAGDYLQVAASETSVNDPDVMSNPHFSMYWVAPR